MKTIKDIIEPVLINCVFVILFPFLLIYFLYLVETGQLMDDY